MRVTQVAGPVPIQFPVGCLGDAANDAPTALRTGLKAGWDIGGTTQLVTPGPGVPGLRHRGTLSGLGDFIDIDQ